MATVERIDRSEALRLADLAHQGRAEAETARVRALNQQGHALRVAVASGVPVVELATRYHCTRQAIYAAVRRGL